VPREVDRPGVDGAEALDELAGAAFRSLRATSRSACVIASGVRSSWERWPRTSALRRRALRAGEHGVERVGEFPELIPAPRQPDPVRQRPVRGHAGGVRDASQRGEHPAGEKPPTQRPNTSRNASTATAAWPKACWVGERPGAKRPADAKISWL